MHLQNLRLRLKFEFTCPITPPRTPYCTPLSLITITNHQCVAVCSVTWPINTAEAEGNLALIQTSSCVTH